MSPATVWESAERYVEVAVAVPLPGTFTYRIPPAWGELLLGQRLLVPFGPRRLTAFVLAVHAEPPADVAPGKLREPIDVLEDESFFDESHIELFKWVSSYYQWPLGEVMAGALPGDSNLSSRKAWLLTEEGQEAALRESEEKTREILAFIGEKKSGISERRVLSRFRGLRLSTLASWQRRGWIEAFQADAGGKKIPQEKVYRLDPRNVAEAGEATLSPKAKKILGYVISKGEASVGELRSEYGSVASSLKTLQNRGLLVPGTREKAVAGLPDMTELAGSGGAAAADFVLNVDQLLAIERISSSIDEGVFAPALLQGVTGSGKTEVYIRLAQHALSQGKSVLVLVPEIALTPQLIGRFARLDVEIAVLHSALGSTQRFDMFRKAARGEAKLVIGARSAVFAPLRNLGLIVVDEEHESSYKQEEAPRYHARDTALVRGKLNSCPVVLGSATPSLETRHNTDRGRYSRYFLPKRATEASMAAVEIVDLKSATLVDEGRFISAPLHQAILETLARKQQIIIYLNRRGYAPFVICVDCGHAVECPDCSVGLVYHITRDRLHCHYCGHDSALPNACSHCAGVEFKMVGQGTQRIEESFVAMYPEARIARMDRDSVARKDAHQELLGRLSRGEIDILIGTQMLTKGLDFPSITLVGVLLADAGLSMPDFRAAERSFQTLVQVAGRAGRGEHAGRVIFQTFQPADPTLQAAVKQDYERFYAEELNRRQAHGFPPFMRQARILVSARNDAEAMEASDAIRAKLLFMEAEGLRILGPNPAPIERIRGQYRWHLLLQSTSAALLARATEIVASLDLETAHRRIVIDVDPVSML